MESLNRSARTAGQFPYLLNHTGLMNTSQRYLLDSTNHYLLWFGGFCDDAVVRGGIFTYSVVKQCLKEFAGSAGCTAVKAKREFVEVIVQVGVSDIAMMRAE